MNPLGVLFLTSLLVRLAGIFTYGIDTSGDFVEFDRLARNLLAGHGYSLEAALPFSPTTQREPLYPLFLALTYAFLGQNPLGVVLLQCLLGSLVSLLVYRIALHLYQDTRVAFLSGLVCAGYLPIAIFNLRLLSETLAIFLVCLTGWQLVQIFNAEKKKLHFGLLGIALGLLTLTKLAFQLLPVCLAALLMGLRGKKELRCVLLFLALTALLVAPWVLFNKRIHGTYALGNSVRMGANVYARVLADGRKASVHGRTQVYQEFLELERSGVPTSQINAQALRAALTIIARHPFRYLGGIFIEIRDLWRFGTDPEEIDTTGPITLAGKRGQLILFLKKMFLVLHFVLLGTGILGFFLKVTPKTFLVFSLVAYLTLVLSLFTCAVPRHNVPVVPLMIIFSCFFFTKSLLPREGACAWRSPGGVG